MRPILLIALASTSLLAGCGSSGGDSGDGTEAPQSQFGFNEAMEQPGILPDISPAQEVADRVTTVDIAESAPDAAPESPAQPSGEPMPEGMPQIAYRYEHSFTVPADVLVPLQEQHADLCASQGPNVCRIISMRQSGGDSDYGYGRLEIQVIASQARDFGKELVGTAEGAGGEQTSSSIAGEDLSKQIVDTEARLRARTLLRDRLMDILRSRNGTVAELVEAERGVAQVNEEIDQARSWLTEMRGRVAFSHVSIQYDTGTRSAARNSGGGFWEPISWALGSAGAALGRAIATIIMLVASLLPWLLALAGIIWGWRKIGLPFWRPFRNRKNNDAPDNEPPEEALDQ